MSVELWAIDETTSINPVHIIVAKKLKNGKVQLLLSGTVVVMKGESKVPVKVNQLISVAAGEDASDLWLRLRRLDPTHPINDE